MIHHLSISSSCKRFLDTDNMQFVSFATELIAKSSLAKEFVYFQQSLVHKTGLILYLADFHSWNWRIPGFDEKKTQH